MNILWNIQVETYYSIINGFILKLSFFRNNYFPIFLSFPNFSKKSIRSYCFNQFSIFGHSWWRGCSTDQTYLSFYLGQRILNELFFRHFIGFLFRSMTLRTLFEAFVLIILFKNEETGSDILFKAHLFVGTRWW